MNRDLYRRAVLRGYRVGKAAIAICLMALLLAACGNDRSLPPQNATDIEQGDVCAVCGMYIFGSPGPRAEAYVEGRRLPLKFDSTRDFLAYVLQPENQSILQHLFVQDTAVIDWNHPSNSASSFVAARSAYYVAWQPLLGAMGPTLASFAKDQDAQAFVKTHGGQILRFDEITPQLISLLESACPKEGSPALKLAAQCSAAATPGNR